ncbi:MAG: alpha/beta hydrolase [Saprospiraceae bacterium]|nr:alpha/beta hydrolase [Saprospiraceae bacterium]
MKKCFFFISYFLLVSLHAQEIIPLYPGTAPGSENWTWEEKTVGANTGNAFVYNVTKPTMTYYRAPENIRTGAVMLVAPGGAFHILSTENEGTKVAEFLNTLGIDAFVLKYRLSRIHGQDPMQELFGLMSDFKKLDANNTPTVELATQDGIRALSMIHEISASKGFDTSKIGMMGFSAGATLTMSVLLSAEQKLKPAIIAPFYLYKPAVIGSIFPEKLTPMFIAVASDDGLKFVPHSIDLYNEWISKAQPTELHIYENGNHGFGMQPKGTASDQWPSDFKSWLKQRKWLE